VDEKSNEIVAIPALLGALDVSGCVVTIDDMGCQTGIAQQIIDQDGDYLLALKGNHPLLYEDTQLLFDHLADCGVTVNEQTYHRQIDKGHGRIEIRQAWVVTDLTILHSLRGTDKWPHLAALAKLEAGRQTIRVTIWPLGP
jgi:predicted transposase YbfD/YdcC